jgi:hypothetical protein
MVTKICAVFFIAILLHEKKQGFYFLVQIYKQNWDLKAIKILVHIGIIHNLEEYECTCI